MRRDSLSRLPAEKISLKFNGFVLKKLQLIQVFWFGTVEKCIALVQTWMRQRTTWCFVSWSRYLAMRRIFLKWKLTEDMRPLMCWVIDIWLSKSIPKLRTDVLGLIMSLPTLSSTGGSFLSPWVVPAMKNSVLLWLSFNLLTVIQLISSDIHNSSFESAFRHASGTLGLKEMYIRVSWLRMILLMRDVYKAQFLTYQ